MFLQKAGSHKKVENVKYDGVTSKILWKVLSTYQRRLTTYKTHVKFKEIKKHQNTLNKGKLHFH